MMILYLGIFFEPASNLGYFLGASAQIVMESRGFEWSLQLLHFPWVLEDSVIKQPDQD